MMVAYKNALTTVGAIDQGADEAQDQGAVLFRRHSERHRFHLNAPYLMI